MFLQSIGRSTTAENTMNKKLITLAVAAALAAPAAAMADATLYGKINMSIDYVQTEANALAYGPGQITYTGTNAIPDSRAISPWGVGPRSQLLAYGGRLIGSGGQKYYGWDLNSNQRSSRLGVKGSEDLGNGLKAIYQIEFGISLTNPLDNSNIANGDSGSISMRNSFVGLAGNWGTVLVGRHDTPLKMSTAKLDLFEDTLADYNWTVGFHDVRANNAIAYVSPTWAGLQFAAAIIPSGGATALGLPNNANTSIAASYSLAAIYSNGPFYASVAYENLGKKNFAGLNGPVYGDYLGVPGWGNADAWSYWRAGLGILDWNGFTLDGVYESHEHFLGAPTQASVNMWQVQAGYAFGNNMLKGMYGKTDPENCVGASYLGLGPNSGVMCGPMAQNLSIASGNGYTPYYANNKNYSSWAVGLDHNFSKRTQVYLLYTATDSNVPEAGWNGLSLGMSHSF
jgi:predicted porin